MPRKPIIPNVLCYDLPDDIVDTPAMRRTITQFVMEREASAALEAVKSLRACVALKRALHIPVSIETHGAKRQLEQEMHALRLALDARVAAEKDTEGPESEGAVDMTRTRNKTPLGKSLTPRTEPPGATRSALARADDKVDTVCRQPTLADRLRR